MISKQKDIEGTAIENHWNGLTPRERYEMILEHPDHFLSLGLVTNDEVERVKSASETELEYIIDRGTPLFHNIDLKGTVYAQTLRKLLKTALLAAFL